jgi:hypothetical protein
MFDATSGGSLVANGGTVRRLEDLSGNGKHMVQAVASVAPLREDNGQNGKTILSCGGTRAMSAGSTSDWNFLHGTQGGTILAVAKPFATTDPNNFAFLVRTNQNSSAQTGISVLLDDRASYPRNNFALIAVTGGTSGQSIASVERNNFYSAANQFQLFSFRLDCGQALAANRVSMLISGVAEGTSTGTLSASANNAAEPFLVGSPSFNSLEAFAEVIVFNSPLSTADRARVEAYLALKWGISGVHAQATATSDPVGHWRDKSGNNRHATQATGTSRPTVSGTTLNGRRQLSFVSQHLRGPQSSWNGSVSIYWAGRTGQSSSGAFVFHDGEADQVSAFHAGWLNAQGVGAYGNGWNSGNAPRAESPNNWRLANIVAGVTLSSSEAIARVNGATVNTTAALTGTLSQSTSAQPFIGRDASNVWNNLNGTIAELLIFQPALTAAQRLAIERYLGSKWSIAIAPQVSNADAQDWVSRVYANGGHVSSATASAVNTLCNSIDAAGIRDRFYRMGIFAGSNLAAALVPLYRGPAFGGTAYGNATDTNVGPFVSADYSETTGLTASLGSTKYLDTGLAPSAMPATVYESMHMSGWHGPIPAVDTDPYIVGAFNSTTDRYGIQVSIRTASQAFELARAGKAAISVSATTGVQGSRPAGFVLAQRQSATSLQLFRNGTLDATSTTSATGIGTVAFPFFVFASNNTGTRNGDQPGMPLRHYSIGDDMTASQVQAFHSALAAFNTAMGRTA